MESAKASTLFEALSSEVRLDLFRLLVRNAPQGLVAGEIARQLGIPPTNLSFHLKAVVHSGLVDAEKEGRYMYFCWPPAFTHISRTLPRMPGLNATAFASISSTCPRPCSSLCGFMLPCGCRPPLSQR